MALVLLQRSGSVRNILLVMITLTSKRKPHILTPFNGRRWRFISLALHSHSLPRETSYRSIWKVKKLKKTRLYLLYFGKLISSFLFTCAGLSTLKTELKSPHHLFGSQLAPELHNGVSVIEQGILELFLGLAYQIFAPLSGFRLNAREIWMW